MTRSDCIDKHLCGPKVRKYVIPTSIIIGFSTFFIFFVAKPWRYLKLDVFIYVQFISLAVLVLIKTI